MRGEVTASSITLSAIVCGVCLCAVIFKASRNTPAAGAWLLVHSARLHAWPGAPSAADPQRVRALRAAAAAPVTVVAMTDHYFDSGDFEGRDFLRRYEPCALDGVPIECIWAPQKSEKHGDSATDNADTADVLAYHGPHSGNLQPQKRREEQVTLMYSHESAGYYPHQNDAAWLAQFDWTMTQRLDSSIPFPYVNATTMDWWRTHPVPPFAERLDALAFVNSNCDTKVGRKEKVQAIMDLGSIPVHAWGECLRNQNLTNEMFDKVSILSRYKFCVAIENSIDEDYVTEKVYDALKAGCMPIYLGVPNIADFLPHPEAVIIFESASQVSEEMLRMTTDEAEFTRRVLSWRRKPLQQLPPNFQQLIAMRDPFDVPCQVCQKVVAERAKERVQAAQERAQERVEAAHTEDARRDVSPVQDGRPD